MAAGISFTPTPVIGPVAGFGVLGAIGTRLLVRPLSAVPTTAPEVLGVHVHA